HAVQPLSFSPETLRRWWISGRRLPKCIADYSQARERRDRQALRSSPALRRAPKTLARRADLRLARAMPKAGQGPGMSQPQSARFPQARFYSPHASKAMQSKMMFPDRLLVGVKRPIGALLSMIFRRYDPRQCAALRLPSPQVFTSRLLSSS